MEERETLCSDPLAAGSRPKGRGQRWNRDGHARHVQGIAEFEELKVAVGLLGGLNFQDRPTAPRVLEAGDSFKAALAVPVRRASSLWKC